MKETATYLFAAAGTIYFALGAIHWWYTFYTRRFNPEVPELMAQMKAISPRISKGTTVWKAWMGFNASHSTGAMFFGFVLVYLPTALDESAIFTTVTVINSLYYVWLARTYWFRIPLIGTAVAAAFVLIALLIQVFG